MTLREWARSLKRDIVALWFAARDPRVPWYAKTMAGAVAAYALSPIDLIPDFIPVLGYLDDLLIVPAGIWLAVRMIRPELMTEFRARASDTARPRSRNYGDRCNNTRLELGIYAAVTVIKLGASREVAVL
jgi:uncharacterized membrane protein YkvA (DUF1232 family)